MTNSSFLTKFHHNFRNHGEASSPFFSDPFPEVFLKAHVSSFRARRIELQGTISSNNYPPVLPVNRGQRSKIQIARIPRVLVLRAPRKNARYEGKPRSRFA